MIVKLYEEDTMFGEWDPVKLTKAINKLLGEIKNAKVLSRGRPIIGLADYRRRY